MFHSGSFVAEHVTKTDGSTVNDEAVQTHGVELGIDEIYSLSGNSFISNEGYVKPDRKALPTRTTDVSGLEYENNEDVAADVVSSEHYALVEGNYVVKYDKIIEIPDDTVGFVFPRSRLMRSGVELSTAVWESGYKGEGEGGLYIDNECMLKADTRIGQIVMARAEVLEEYDGSHQHENITE